MVIAEQGSPGIYPAMSGHNIMCVATALLETGMVPILEPVSEFALDLPAGLVRVRADCAGGKAIRVTLRNAPAFCRPEDMDVVVDVPHVGKVTLDPDPDPGPKPSPDPDPNPNPNCARGQGDARHRVRRHANPNYRPKPNPSPNPR